ncbi:hypothetical protein DEFDS_P255 (plasmid) [Deferribacter desulfuricans SSM1]|uniref:Uncharacterized protein n=1 Tax=Deferribacter desulfuricans (strain DSM 14783 / JCM 11476 / NBRC 101012 / SSM1) TaxID=639282 RepID=D3PF83_DEFDS|nr:hypothetical protein [Deferribacter desulfuricans]BAI81875.1 hypothetical protein DEFDS_P255 [Deferribacter desulfuricans SSM1]
MKKLLYVVIISFLFNLTSFATISNSKEDTLKFCKLSANLHIYLLQCIHNRTGKNFLDPNNRNTRLLLGTCIYSYQQKHNNEFQQLLFLTGLNESLYYYTQGVISSATLMDYNNFYNDGVFTNTEQDLFKKQFMRRCVK